jgi:hypothetical protein
MGGKTSYCSSENLDYCRNQWRKFADNPGVSCVTWAAQFKKSAVILLGPIFAGRLQYKRIAIALSELCFLLLNFNTSPRWNFGNSRQE